MEKLKPFTSFKVTLKNKEDLKKLGFVMETVDDGVIEIYKKGSKESLILYNQIELEPHLVVNCNTIHENAIKIYPDAFNIILES